MSTPWLAVDGQVKIVGKVATPEEIKAVLLPQRGRANGRFPTSYPSIGFIGGGRVARILLGGPPCRSRILAGGLRRAG